MALERSTRLQAAGKGALGKCPACGQGRLLRRYLQPAEKCTSCGEPLGHLRSDDAAPWLTILIVGHLLVPFVIPIEAADILPPAVSSIGWPMLALVLAGFILPRAKGLFLGLLWFDQHASRVVDGACAPPTIPPIPGELPAET
ncbi:DUF983 domain-containing protein [Parvularcula lutaonensis]|uniref:DUF983 domain-containing protein n=1 Tax=Parvularcula lutaonensis TaxID=491923 RepID=A0ABV7MDD7_9PROT|nr:DUF983 domain-containing protein [Parvularcula lutaonensis]GGY52933.1 hypothetical protein GCM10007148_22690 [Parvularcula lutaonensis]